MNRVLVFVEGQTELTFVREVIAPHLGQFGLMVNSRLVGKPGHKGGVPPFPKFLREIAALLREDSNIICTTMFDYYGMPSNWPQREEARSAPHEQKPVLIERSMVEEIIRILGDSFNANRFLPYVQMHEFEALLFSAPHILAEVILYSDSVKKLTQISDQFEHPEQINDDVNSAPSKRILHINPAYQKVIHGNLAAKRIGLQQMRQKCPHFNDWIAKLEQLRVSESS